MPPFLLKTMDVAAAVAATTSTSLEMEKKKKKKSKDNVTSFTDENEPPIDRENEMSIDDHHHDHDLLLATKKRLHEDFIPVGPKKACLLHSEEENNDNNHGTSSSSLSLRPNNNNNNNNSRDAQQQQQLHEHSFLMHLLLLQGKKGIATNLSRVIAENGSLLEIVQLFQLLFQTSRVETFALDLVLEYWKLFPESAQQDVLPLFATYECWQQLLLLLKLIMATTTKQQHKQRSSSLLSKQLQKKLYNAVLELFKEQWESDVFAMEKYAVRAEEEKEKNEMSAEHHYHHHPKIILSCMALWLPRERGKWDRELDFVRRFSRILYPTSVKRQVAKAFYRKEVKSLTELYRKILPSTTTTTTPCTCGDEKSKQQQQYDDDDDDDDKQSTVVLLLPDNIEARTPLIHRWKPTSALFSFPTKIRFPTTWKQRFLTTHTATDACDYVTLPRTGRVDDHFMGDALLTKAGETFLQKGTRHYTKNVANNAGATTETTTTTRRQQQKTSSLSSSPKLLYIHQGEVGHATSDQCDVIVSDRATTCHVLAFRSESHDTTSSSLTSLAHIDATFYDDCVQSMIETHIAHHRNNNNNKSSTLTTATTAGTNSTSSGEDEKKSESSSGGGPSSEQQQPLLDIQIHICGGFDDDRQSSHRITEWLFHLLAWLAEEYKDTITMTLVTCVLSSMNDTGNSAPVGRGMGIDLHTGEAFMAKVDAEVCGPAQLIRNARIWTPGDGTLNVVHTAKSNDFIIKPFAYQGGTARHNGFLQLPDEKMILKTSTSPDVEEDDFCLSVRNTLRFMKEVKSRKVFGPEHDKTLVFRRIGHSNSWKRVHDDTITN